MPFFSKTHISWAKAIQTHLNITSYYLFPNLLTNKLFFISSKLAFIKKISYLCLIVNYKCKFQLYKCKLQL